MLATHRAMSSKATCTMVRGRCCLGAIFAHAEANFQMAFTKHCGKHFFFFLFSSRKSFQNICIYMCVYIHIYLQNLSFKRSIQEHVLKVFSLQILFTNSFQNTSWTFLFVFVVVFFFEK